MRSILDLSNSRRAVERRACIATMVSLFACTDEAGRVGPELADQVHANRQLLEVSAEDLLQPAPTQPVGSYDHFGELLSPRQAARRVLRAGLNPFRPSSYERLGMVRITRSLIARGKLIFEQEEIGDAFGLQEVFGFRDGIVSVLPEIAVAILKLRGEGTSNLRIELQKSITLGSRVFPEGSEIATGFDVEPGALLPIGVRLDGNITCAVCHSAVDPVTKERLDGVPNGDLNVAALIALAPNSAAGFARLAIDPADPALQGNGLTIENSEGQLVQLPDPTAIEQRMDDLVLTVPAGNFESSPDRINNTTQIPSVFTWRSGPFGWDGNFAVGPFGGLSAINSAVHSSEINLLAAGQNSAEILGIDPEVYLGVLLQNAADPGARLPTDRVVRPSEWLRQIEPDPNRAELEDQVPAPGLGEYPNLAPSSFTYNGLVFSPKTRSFDLAAGKFMRAVNAMAVYQNSLLPPANRSAENEAALASGSVARGAEVFIRAQCTSCHSGPFFTDNTIHPVETVGSNPARGQSRLGLEPFLRAPKLYSFDTRVPIPGGSNVIDVPTEGITETPTSLPIGLSGSNGAYKTPSLRGLAFSAPYLHDGGVAVRAGALRVEPDGSFSIVDPTGLGLPGTLSQSIMPDAASSLRALLDRTLRGAVVATNQAFPALVISNLSGEGHDFYVDQAAGFTAQEQADLVNFLLALDDNPGEF